MMKDVVQYSICTQRNYIYVMMVSFIHLQLLFFVFMLFVILHSLQLTLMFSQIDCVREKTVFSPSANKILNSWMVIRFSRQVITEPDSRLALSLVVKQSFLQRWWHNCC